MGSAKRILPLSISAMILLAASCPLANCQQPPAPLPNHQAVPAHQPAQYIIEAPDMLTVRLLSSSNERMLEAERSVQQDGSIDLGVFGNVVVGGLTIDQARDRIEKLVASMVHNPKVQVDIYSYNSKAFYVVTGGNTKGEAIVRLPYTGNETVLDAIAQSKVVPLTGASARVWVARPGTGVLPVKWEAIVQAGDPTTNYRLQPSDRLYVENTTRAPNQSSLTITAAGNKVQLNGPGFTATADRIVSGAGQGAWRLEGNVRIQVQKDGIAIDLPAQQVDVSMQDGSLQIKNANAKE